MNFLTSNNTTMAPETNAPTTQNAERQLTFGEKAVGITFNPGKN